MTEPGGMGTPGTALETMYAELRATIGAYLEARAGRGHPGEPHDRLLHTVGLHGDDCLGTWDDDCSNCAGQQYGTEVTLHDLLAEQPS